MDLSFELLAAVKQLALPPTAFLCLAVIGIVFYRRKGSAIAVVWLALALLYVSCTAHFAAWINRPLENWYPVLSIQDLQRLRVLAQSEKGKIAIVVLGGGLRTGATDTATGHGLSQYGLQRVAYGAYVHKQTGIPVLVSGGILYPSKQTEAVTMSQFFADYFGVQTTWLEDKSINTRENAAMSLELLRKSGVSDIVLVTSAMHMPRSMPEFEGRGLRVLAAPTGQWSTGPQTWRSWIPSISAAQRTAEACHEWLGMAWYKWRY